MGPDKFQNITTILFDLDNTLINTKVADRMACDKVFQYLLTDGVRRSVAKSAVDQFYASIRDTPLDPTAPESDPRPFRILLWRRALGPALSTKAGRCYSIWDEHRNRNLHMGQGTEEMLFQLRKRYKLGLITNGSSRCQWEKIDRVNGSGQFDCIVVSGDVGPAKPSPAIFEAAFRRLDVSGLECAMIGDRLDTDILGAVRAGCGVTVLLSPTDSISPANKGSDPVVPDFVIRDLGELPDLIPDGKGFSSMCRDRTVGLFHSLREDDDGWNLLD